MMARLRVRGVSTLTNRTDDDGDARFGIVLLNWIEKFIVDKNYNKGGGGFKPVHPLVNIVLIHCT